MRDLSQEEPPDLGQEEVDVNIAFIDALVNQALASDEDDDQDDVTMQLTLALDASIELFGTDVYLAQWQRMHRQLPQIRCSEVTGNHNHYGH